MMKVGKVEIACNNIGMNNKMCGALDDKAKKIMSVSDAQYPLLAEDDLFLRASIVVMIGFDVYVGGLPGIGAKKIFNKMNEVRKEESPVLTDEILTAKLKKWVCAGGKTKNKKDDTNNFIMPERIFEIFVNAIVYEPSNEIIIDRKSKGQVIFENNSSEYTCIHSVPPVFSLPEYLKGCEATSHDDMISNQGNVACNKDKLCFCPGPNLRSGCNLKHHLVMKNEGVAVKCQHKSSNAFISSSNVSCQNLFQSASSICLA